MMNAPIIDPLLGDFPEVIEEYLQHGIMKSIAFNRRGTLLAAGCSDGSCVIWDFETRGIAKELRDKDCVSPITSVCWSKLGHHLLASSTDKSLFLWDVKNGTKVARVTLPQTTLLARLHPSSHMPTVSLACPLSSAPILVDLNTGNTTTLPVSVSESGTGLSSNPRNRTISPTAATFNKYGDLIYVGNNKGEILIVDYNSQVLALVPSSGSSIIKNITFSRNGMYLLTNSNDRVIRLYENLLPIKGAAKALEEMGKDTNEFHGIEKLKAVGSKCLLPSREFQDVVTKMQWKAPCFSGDGEWVVSASASKGEHKIYIWDRSGYLVKILEGPKEALIDLLWHPVRPLVVSVSVTGLVYIWAKDYTENWSAFAPDFKELEENEEYVEREDEFDVVPDTQKVKKLEMNLDDDVDILTVEKDSTFSDSDVSQDELIFLPTDPLPDVTDPQEDKGPTLSSKLDDSDNSNYPFMVEPDQNGHTMLPISSPAEVVGNFSIDDTEGTVGSKRKRKPSAKVLELQEDNIRKPAIKARSAGKPPKSKNRYGNGDMNEFGEDDDIY